MDDGSWKKKRDGLEDRCRTVEVFFTIAYSFPWFLHSIESCALMWMSVLPKRHCVVVRLKKAHNRFKKLSDPGQVHENHAALLSWQVNVRQDDY